LLSIAINAVSQGDRAVLERAEAASRLIVVASTA
jgi:hypothetical protein